MTTQLSGGKIANVRIRINGFRSAAAKVASEINCDKEGSILKMETKTNKLGRCLGVLLTVIVLMAGLLVIPESAGAAAKKSTSLPKITATNMQYPPDHIAKGKKCHLGGVVKVGSDSYIYQVRARITNRVTGKSAMLAVWRPKGNRKPRTVNIANTINPLVKFAKLPAGHYTINMFVFARNSKGTVSKRVMHKGFTVDR